MAWFCSGDTFFVAQLWTLKQFSSPLGELLSTNARTTDFSKYLSFGVKFAKIGPMDPEIICLRAIIKKKKKKEINASKIYSPVGNLAERAK